MSYDRGVACSAEGCVQLAAFKIAAPWRDRRFLELKTYGFACEEHIHEVLRQAEIHWLEYEPVAGEVVEDVGIYRLPVRHAG